VPTVSWRMLRFPDQTQVRVNCLNEILAELYSEGRQVNKETAEEIINRLEAKKNYIHSSDRARKEYAYVLLKEYRKYVKGRADNNR
jgi:predicted transcriptional regulator